mmetsp:Transcript_84555/g.262576  ORF Transcript_84555/g.262576 Transcript_84555/m.262576 type:complete len:322 (+) Transcript_84555:1239-2204(+)
MGLAELPEAVLGEIQPLARLDPILVFTDGLVSLSPSLQHGALHVKSLVNLQARIEHREHHREVLQANTPDVGAVEARIPHYEGPGQPMDVRLVGRKHAEEQLGLRLGDRLDEETPVSRKEEELAGFGVRRHALVRWGTSAERLEDLPGVRVPAAVQPCKDLRAPGLVDHLLLGVRNTKPSPHRRNPSSVVPNAIPHCKVPLGPLQGVKDMPSAQSVITGFVDALLSCSHHRVHLVAGQRRVLVLRLAGRGQEVLRHDDTVGVQGGARPALGPTGRGILGEGVPDERAVPDLSSVAARQAPKSKCTAQPCRLNEQKGGLYVK